MSYSIRAIVGAEAFELPDFVGQPNISYEQSATGSFKGTYAKNGVNASRLTSDTLLEVRYKNQQLYDSYFLLQDGDDPDEASGKSFSVVGRSLHDLFRRVVVRNPDLTPPTAERGPTQKPLVYEDKTIGYILINLLTQAQARGALTGITWNFTALKDSYGSDWGTKVWREYEPGMKYEAIFQDWFETMGVSYRFLGNRLEVYLEENFGRDLSTGPNLLEFIAGVDYEETPKKWSVKDRAKYSLIIGEEGIFDESLGNAPVGLYGREEQSISQGSVKNEGMLGYINDASLKMISKAVREEYTRKITMQDGRYIAGLDFRPGDKVRERVGSRSSEPLRILSMVLELPYNGANGSTSIVYNDKLMDQNQRIGRIISRLSGGTTTTGPTGPKDTDSPPPDTMPPAAPSVVAIDTYSFRASDGTMQGVAALDWPDVSTNQNGTPTDDIDHYEYRWKTGMAEPAGTPKELGPGATSNLNLNGLFDRRQKPHGWLAGDGGASVRKPDGKDLWIFSDSVIGRADGSGKILGNAGQDWGMVNNALVETDPNDATKFKSLLGQRNLLTRDYATFTRPWVDSEWLKSSCTATIVDEPSSYSSRALEITSTAAGGTSYTYQSKANAQAWGSYRDLVPGKTYTIKAKATGIGIAALRVVSVYLLGYTSANTQVSGMALGHTNITPANPEAEISFSFVAPATVSWGTPLFYTNALVTGEKVRFYDLAIHEGDQRHQSWTLSDQTPAASLISPVATGWKNKEFASDPTNFRQTLKTVGGELRVIHFGDSIVEGVMSDTTEKAWPSKFRDQINAEYRKGGVATYIPASNHDWVNNGVTRTAAADRGTNYGISNYTTTVDAGEFVQWPAKRCVSAEIFFTKTNFFAGTFDVLVDGVKKLSAVSTYKDVSAESGFSVRVDGLTDANHTIKVVGTTGSGGGATIEGVLFREANTKLAYINAGHAGHNFANLITGAQSKSAMEVAKYIAPHAVRVSLGSNDMVVRSATQFAADALAFVNLIKTNVPAIESIVVDVWIDPWSATVSPYEDYVTETRKVLKGLDKVDLVIMRDFAPKLEERTNLAGSSGTMIPIPLGNVVRTLDVVEDGKTWTRFDVNTGGHGSRLLIATSRVPPLGGDYTLSWEMKNVGASTARFYLDFNDRAGVGSLGGNKAVDLAAGETRRVYVTLTDFNTTSTQRYFDAAAAVAGSSFLIREPLVEEGTQELPYFDGSSTTANSLVPAWANSAVDSSGTITKAGGTYTQNITAASGSKQAASVKFTNPTDAPLTASMVVRGTKAGSFGSESQGLTVTETVPAKSSRRLFGNHTLSSTSDGFRIHVPSTASVGLVLSDVYTGPGEAALPYRMQWEGAANTSASMAAAVDFLADGVHPGPAGSIQVADAMFALMEDPTSDYYWFGDGWTFNGKVHVLAQLMGRHWPTPEGWNFDYKQRVDLVTWDAATMKLESIKPLYEGVDSPSDAVIGGSSVWLMGHEPDGRANLWLLGVGYQDTINLVKAYVVPNSKTMSALELDNVTGQFISRYIEGTQLREVRFNIGDAAVDSNIAIYRVPEVSGPRYAYIPRIHKQFDTAQGRVFGYSTNTSADWKKNVVHGAPRFARGPAGQMGVVDLSGRPWAGITVSKDSMGSISPLLPNTSLYVEARTIDNAGNASTWKSSSTVIVSPDTTPPEAPSTPTVVSFFQGIRVTWDGLDSLGSTPPPEWKHLEVHVSAIDDFYPTAETLVEIITAPGTVPALGLAPNAEYFAKLVAVNNTGTRSEASAQASAITDQLVNEDLPDKLVTGAKVAKEAINATHLTVSAFSDNLLRNGNVEEWEGNLPFGLSEYWWGDSNIIPSKGAPLGGSASFQVYIPSTATDDREWKFAPVPVIEKKLYYFAADVKTSDVVLEGTIKASVVTGATPADCNGYNGAFPTNINITNQGTAGNIATVEGSFEIPAGCRYAALVVSHQKTAGKNITVNWDNFRLNELIGGAEIAYAQLHTAHISYLDLNEGNISKLNVGRLDAGIMTADVTISNRFKTANSGVRVELNTAGVRGYNAAGEVVSELRSSDGGLVSKWFRTNTSGSRIEMGTYGAGAGSALIAFFSDSSTWQFPPAMGYGGGGRYNLPGIGIHAGSVSESAYLRYGMHMMGIDQQGGFGVVTGNLLNGTNASDGAPIILNANGPRGIVDILSGTGNNSRVYLHPDSTKTVISLNRGRINFGTEGSSLYTIGHVKDTEWGGWPYNHLHFSGNSTFRFSTDQQPQAMTISPGGIIGGPDWNGAARIKPRGTDDHYVALFYDGTNFGMVAYNRMNGNQVDIKAFQTK